jgi:hypothetical protein
MSQPRRYWAKGWSAFCNPRGLSGRVELEDSRETPTARPSGEDFGKIFSITNDTTTGSLCPMSASGQATTTRDTNSTVSFVASSSFHNILWELTVIWTGRKNARACNGGVVLKG